MTAATRRLVFLSSIAVPHQIRLCEALQPYFDAEFWFYEAPDRTRGTWWRVDLGDHCRVLDDVRFFSSGPLAEKYLVGGLARKLEAFDPDVVMVGGFSIPANYLAYRWARKNGRKTVVLTERSRDRSGKLRTRSAGWRVLQHLYRDVDMVMTTADDIVDQFRSEFRFGDKVVAGRYAVDIDDYADHAPRTARSAYTYLFANRMTEIYNPVGAIEIFSAILTRHPGSRLLMNAAGELGERCRQKIAELDIGSAVEFLTDIATWEDLPKIYERADILLLPASFSNGNFTILEAMASGMGIVISNRVLGVGKLVEDGVNGFNCEPTTHDFVERVERYVADPGLFEEHARLNREIVAPLGAAGTARLYFEILSERVG
ncbi:glycosyltransferase involved in cell wall biosynthesis [Amorphus suaedae]